MSTANKQVTTVTDPPGLLESCPFCGYSLAGLPVEHRCPECGQAVDRRWVVFGGVRRLSESARALIVGLSIHISFVLLALMWLIAFTTGGVSFSWRGPFAIIGGTFASLLVGAWWLYRFVPPCFIAIADDGVKLCRKSPRVETIAWRDLRAVRQPVVTKYVEFETARGVVRFSTFGFGLDYDLRMRCAAALRAALAQRAAGGEQP